MRFDDDAEREEHEDQLGLLVDSRSANELAGASQDSQRSTLFTVCPFILGTVAAGHDMSGRRLDVMGLQCGSCIVRCW